VKKVEAIITPHILDAVREALNERGCHEIVLSEVRTSPINASTEGHYRLNAYEMDVPKLKIEAIVQDVEAMPVAQAILHASHVQARADSEITLSSLEEVVSIGVSMVESHEPEELNGGPQPMRPKSSPSQTIHA
jgi:nitrogen regulatory protein P-II 1